MVTPNSWSGRTVATELERAVIEAARALAHATADDELMTRLLYAVQALDAGQDPAVREIGWYEVVEGDRLKSVKTGDFYEVTAAYGSRTARKIGVNVNGKVQMITRPIEGEPTAFVKRGATGQAVDVFVEVFSSEEAK